MLSAKVSSDSLLTLACNPNYGILTGGVDGKLYRLMIDETSTKKDDVVTYTESLGIKKSPNAHLLGVQSIATYGSMAASVGMNGEVSLWNLPDLSKLATLTGDPLSNWNCCFVPPFSSSNNNTLSLSSNNTLPLILTGSQNQGIQVIKINKEDTLDLMGEEEDNTTTQETQLEKISTISTSTLYNPSITNNNFILSITASPDGTRGAAGHADGSVTLFDLHTSSVITTFHAHQMGVRTISFSSNGKELYTGSDDSRIGIFDITATLSSSLHSNKHHHQSITPLITPLTGHHGFITKITAGPIDKENILFSSSADKTVKIWDTRKRSCIHTFEGHIGTVWGVDYSIANTHEGGYRLASVSEAGNLLVNKLQTII